MNTAATNNDWSDEDCLLPEWAVRRSGGNYMEPGAQLATRDGRRCGNAYVDRTEPHDSLGLVAVVVTDMGNSMRMTLRELEELFHSPAYVMRLDEARARRVLTPNLADERDAGTGGEASDAALLAAWQNMRHRQGMRHWPADFDQVIADPVRKKLITLEAQHVRAAPAVALPPGRPATAPLRPALSPRFDHKRAAAGERDDD